MKSDYPISYLANFQIEKSRDINSNLLRMKANAIQRVLLVALAFTTLLYLYSTNVIVP